MLANGGWDLIQLLKGLKTSNRTYSAVQWAFNLGSSKCQLDSVHTMWCIKAGEIVLK